MMLMISHLEPFPISSYFSLFLLTLKTAKLIIYESDYYLVLDEPVIPLEKGDG